MISINYTEDFIANNDTLLDNGVSTLYYAISRENTDLPIYINIDGETAECQISFKDKENFHRVLINFYPYGVACVFKRNMALPEDVSDEDFKNKFIERICNLALVAPSSVIIKNLVIYINERGFTFFIDRKNNIILFFARSFIFKRITGQQLYEAFRDFIMEEFPSD